MSRTSTAPSSGGSIDPNEVNEINFVLIYSYKSLEVVITAHKNRIGIVEGIKGKVKLPR